MTWVRIANALRRLADRLDPPPGEWVELGRGPAPVWLYVSPLDRTRHDR